MIYHDAFVQIEGPQGEVLTMHVDPDRLEAHLKELAPADGAAIERFTRALRRFGRFEFFRLLVARPWEMVRLLPFLPAVIRWSRVTLEQYAQRFSDLFLRQAFPRIQYDFDNIPVLISLIFLSGCHNHYLGWPRGGSLPFAQSIAQRLEDLGGEIQYRACVDKVLVEDDRAVGVRLVDGSEHRADVVVSAADGRTTIFDMLGGRYVDDRFRRYYEAVPASQPMNLHVCLGVGRELALDATNALTLILEQPISIAGRTVERLHVELYGEALGCAPPGKTAVKVLLETEYGYWQALATDRPQYEAERKRVLAAVIEVLDRRFPGLRDDLEVTDVATPLTIERYTGNHHGLQAWGLPDGTILDMFKGMGHTLPGLDGFYMAGQWASSLGLSNVAINARQLIARLCRQEGRAFVTALPD